MPALEWIIDTQELVQPDAPPSSPPPLSGVDKVSAPVIFIGQTLAFKQALDAAQLRSAVRTVQALMPMLSCRATMTEVRMGTM